MMFEPNSGNVALHLFTEELRERYDLESLWSLGPEFDEKCNKRISHDDADNFEGLDEWAVNVENAMDHQQQQHQYQGLLSGLQPAISTKPDDNHAADKTKKTRRGAWGARK